MQLSDLQQMGALASDKLIQREVQFKRPVQKPREEWTDPETPEFTGETVEESMTVHIRRKTAADTFEFVRATDREQPFVAVLRFICTPDGKPVFESLEQAMRLESWLAFPLFEAISEAQDDLPKASRRGTSGGANSPSPSADAASVSGSNASAPKKNASGSSTAESAAP